MEDNKNEQKNNTFLDFLDICNSKLLNSFSNVNKVRKVVYVIEPRELLNIRIKKSD